MQPRSIQFNGPWGAYKQSMLIWLAVSLLDFAYHEPQQIHTSVRVSPLVIIPAHQFEKPAVELDSRAGVEDAGKGIMDEIGRNHLIFGVSENPLEIRLAGLLHGGADFLVTGRL